MKSEDGNQIYLTIKNYKQSSGLSVRFHEHEGETFEVKGPMGKGLEPSQNGLHIAFAAGTGVLVFVDLVAHLILQHFGLADKIDNGKGNPVNKESFRFLFYVSF